MHAACGVRWGHLPAVSRLGGKVGNPTKPADDARRLRREEKVGNPTKLLRLRCEAVTGNLT
jgi:hypothetical protein